MRKRSNVSAMYLSSVCYFCLVRTVIMRIILLLFPVFQVFGVGWRNTVKCFETVKKKKPHDDLNCFSFLSFFLLSYYFISCCMTTRIPFPTMTGGPWLASSPALAPWGWTRPSGWQGNSSAPWPLWGNRLSAQTPLCTWYVPAVRTQWGSVALCDAAFECLKKDKAKE